MFWIYLVAVALVYSLTRNVFLQRLSGFLISILLVIAGAIAYGGSVGTAEAYAKGF